MICTTNTTGTMLFFRYYYCYYISRIGWYHSFDGLFVWCCRNCTYIRIIITYVYVVRCSYLWWSSSSISSSVYVRARCCVCRRFILLIIAKASVLLVCVCWWLCCCCCYYCYYRCCRCCCLLLLLLILPSIRIELDWISTFKSKIQNRKYKNKNNKNENNMNYVPYNQKKPQERTHKLTKKLILSIQHYYTRSKMKVWIYVYSNSTRLKILYDDG